MDLQTLPKLPIINFNEEELKPGSPNWLLTCAEVRRALEEYGCFVAVYGGLIPPELRDEVFHESEQLFNLPLETKTNNTAGNPLFAYFASNPTIQLYESLGIDHATNFETVQNFSKLLWRNGNHNFCEIVHGYAKLVSQLEQLVTKMIFESYGIDEMKKCDNHIDSMTYLLRLIKYKVPKDEETDRGVPLHTDKSFLTIVDQNQVNGLQVQTKDQQQWISVDFPPSSFAVFAGDGMLAWSNGRVHSPIHGVVMRGKETRYSLALFSHHKGIVEIPEELIDDENPQCFRPFDHLGYMTFYNKQIQSGPIIGSHIQTYCGI